jgi:DNA polymerase III alpha subunit
MATFELTTDEDSIRCIVFPQSYSKHMDMIEEGKVVAISGVVKDDDDDKTFIVNEISSNYERFILETKVKADEFIDWFNTNDDALIKATLKINNKLPVGIVISDYLSYILEK